MGSPISKKYYNKLSCPGYLYVVIHLKHVYMIPCKSILFVMQLQHQYLTNSKINTFLSHTICRL